MADPFYAEIRIFGFNYPPIDWASCDGTILAVNQNAALYSLIGNTYGGSYPNNFALPDLRGNAVIGTGVSAVSGNDYTLDEKVAQNGQSVTLTASQAYPSHTHIASASAATPATATNPAGLMPGSFAAGSPQFVYYNYVKTPAPSTLVAMDPRSLPAFGSQTPSAHENRQPYLAMNFCICTSGIYPMFD